MSPGQTAAVAVHPPISPTTTPDPYLRATLGLLHAALLAVGANFPLRPGIAASLPLAVILFPLWIASVRRYPFAPTLLILAAASAASGLVLSEIAAVDHSVDPTIRFQAIGLLLSGISGLALLLWARTQMPLSRVVLLYATGAVVGRVLDGTLDWKFHLAVPTITMVLVVTERSKRQTSQAAVLITLGAVGLADGARSVFGFCVLTAAISVWDRRPSRKISGRWYPALLLAAGATGVYMLATALLTGGYLGSEAQERTAEQVEAGGSLIAGGRPEFGASRELVKLRPLGFGAGVVPNWDDVQAAKVGLHALNVELEQTRRQYMFGGQFKLHSVAADLWVSYGLVGVALAVTIAFALVRSLSMRLAARRAPTYVIFSVILGLWHLLFGPIYSNWLDVCFALGVALLSDQTSDDSPIPAGKVA